MLTLYLSLSLVCIIPTDILLLVLFLGTPVISLSSIHIIHSDQNTMSSAWEKHKQTIKKYWVDDKKPLKEVIQIMKEEHGFSRS
jgi:hypothetical protein